MVPVPEAMEADSRTVMETAAIMEILKISLEVLVDSEASAVSDRELIPEAIPATRKIITCGQRATT